MFLELVIFFWLNTRVCCLLQRIQSLFEEQQSQITESIDWGLWIWCKNKIPVDSFFLQLVKLLFFIKHCCLCFFINTSLDYSVQLCFCLCIICEYLLTTQQWIGLLTPSLHNELALAFFMFLAFDSVLGACEHSALHSRASVLSYVIQYKSDSSG